MSVATNTVYDVIVIGGGPGGYSTAFRAAQLGLSVGLVEVFKPGGVCLHAGCVPYKALEACVRTLATLEDAGRFGIIGGRPKPSLSAMIERKNDIVGRLADDLSALIKEHKIAYFHGLGAINGAGVVDVRDVMTGNETTLRGRNIVLATGSKPRMIPGIMADGVTILYSDHIVDKRNLPATLAIIGGGAIGVETSTFYAALGCAVTILEVAPRLMMPEDEDISAELGRRYADRDIKTELGIGGLEVESDRKGVNIKYKNSAGLDRQLKAECLLVAAGREAFLDGLGLASAGVKVDRGFVLTDAGMKTNVAGIYAVGDVSGPPLMAHKAMAEGMIAAERIAGLSPQPLSIDLLPHCTFCDPEIGSVGLTEADAAKAGLSYKIGRSYFQTNAKAMCEGREGGFAKVITERDTGKILGAHIIGANATELISAFVETMRCGGTIGDVQEATLAHPTRSEVIKEAALDTDDKAPLKPRLD